MVNDAVVFLEEVSTELVMAAIQLLNIYAVFSMMTEFLFTFLGVRTYPGPFVIIDISRKSEVYCSTECSCSSID